MKLARTRWTKAVRIIRSIFPPIDLFEDIADPADWAAIMAAEQKTNPRLAERLGEVERVPAGRRVGGTGSSYLMAPFTHVSADRQSRFSDGSFGVLYVADRFEVALAETIHHHERFMAATAEPESWTNQFREIVLDVDADLHVVDPQADAGLLHPDDYTKAQEAAAGLRAAGSDGLRYPSVRQPGGACVALFYPDCASAPVQGRHLAYHWNGECVDLVRDYTHNGVFRVER
ncbi:RES family NAD+ phosphorylase [Aureimonas altamirensis]|uniref:RES family NAD+ phosphorylase n=1 Tax=Aureimonas altamirensis TaxID=370622 RepID=UPI001E53DEE1|nr:RES family NAD+ phosphorylase [Aureimonas altamirensis]UHD44277.1 RES family NAD+ phosphorylase [Aureimonas altamirensis]